MGEAAVRLPYQLSPTSARFWDLKYRLKDANGLPVDQTIESTWDRIAVALASVEEQPALWMDLFYEALYDFKFLPGGRIIAGAGTERQVTLFNCFVMGTIPDSMDGIFTHLREAALTMQQGGGIGMDFSTLRPKGARVVRLGADASGPLSFMDVWDAMCRTVMSAGSRRGAMMATLRCDHPDIEAFVEAKREPGRLRMFNLSVLVTDAFLRAVQEDGPWELTFDGKVYKTIGARDLWLRIMRATYDVAEPGVLFIDRINATNNLRWRETISASNPCGEQLLPPYGACLLGSINLAKLVVDPFTNRAGIDEVSLKQLVTVAVRMLDNVVDISNYPVAEQAIEARAKRRLGLGVTGLADALIMVGLTYGTPAATRMAGRWMRLIAETAYQTSAELAKEKGPFLAYASKHVACLPKWLPEHIQLMIQASGIRNSHLTSIAPTGTISLLAGNVSGGIEPVFSFDAERAVIQPDGTRPVVRVIDYAYDQFRRLRGAAAPLPPAFVDAQTLGPDAHLAMQGALQEFVDSSISKTINLPADISFEAFANVYTEAYRLGCKGCTTYRPNEVTGAVLTVPGAAPAAPTVAPPQPSPPALAPRETVLPGKTYKLKWPEADHAFYVTMNDTIDEGGRRRPFEMFINTSAVEHYAWMVALTRMVSAVFRRGGEVAFVAKELQSVFDPRGGAWMGKTYRPSLLAAIGGVVEEHMQAIGFLPPSDVGRADPDPEPEPDPVLLPATPGPRCPQCSLPGLLSREGCLGCPSCGWSKCA